MKNLMRTMILATIALAVAVTVQAAPVNDDWNNATLLQGLSGNVVGTVMGATLQGCEASAHTYPDGGGVLTHKTVWYKFFVPANGSYTVGFDEDETNINTVVSAYRMQLVLCNGNLMPVPYRIVENDKYNSAFKPNAKGRITFRGAASEFIYISVDTANGEDGQFHLLWSKTRFRYDTQLDYTNGGADLAVKRLSIFSPTQWWTAQYKNMLSFSQFANKPYGLMNDRTFMADFDGDGISDMVAVRQDANSRLVWWIANRDGQVINVVEFGLNTDTPIVGDYDGDGIADIAVTRDDAGSNSKTWHILRSSDGQYSGVRFGLPGDREMVGDYDGDGKTDVVVLRPENGTLRWYILKSSTNQVIGRVFGNDVGDVPQTVDFDGDGLTDVAVFRKNHPEGGTAAYDGYWFSVDSNSPSSLEARPIRFQSFGQADDVPQAADFDGDLRTDLAVFRQGQWWIRRSGNGQVENHAFGANFDQPMSDGGNTLAQQF